MKPRISFTIKVAIFMLATVFIWLAFCGNPQWHKYIYVAQELIYQKEPEVPKNFTGVWTRWNMKKRCCMQQEYLNGELHGKTIILSESGELLFKGQFEHGKEIGVSPAIDLNNTLHSGLTNRNIGASNKGMNGTR